MRHKLLDGTLETALSGGDAAADAKRIANRRLFREMVKGEVAESPLTFSRRRALVRFARRLAIQPTEANLIIRGVEYEHGQVPAEAVLELMRGTKHRGLAPTDVESALRVGFYVLLTLLYCLVIRWAVGLLFLR